jgi:hypothetical protein
MFSGQPPLHCPISQEGDGHPVPASAHKNRDKLTIQNIGSQIAKRMMLLRSNDLFSNVNIGNVTQRKTTSAVPPSTQLPNPLFIFSYAPATIIITHLPTYLPPPTHLFHCITTYSTLHKFRPPSAVSTTSWFQPPNLSHLSPTSPNATYHRLYANLTHLPHPQPPQPMLSRPNPPPPMPPPSSQPHAINRNKIQPQKAHCIVVDCRGLSWMFHVHVCVRNFPSQTLKTS